jgi:hypothetical protein
MSNGLRQLSPARGTNPPALDMALTMSMEVNNYKIVSKLIVR